MILRNPVRHWKQSSSFRIARGITAAFGSLSYLYFPRSAMMLWIFLRLSPLPPQLIFQLDTFSTGERVRVRGKESTFFWFIILTPGQPPHPACRPPSPPCQGEKGTGKTLPLKGHQSALLEVHPSIDPNGHAVDHVCANVTAA